MRSEKNGIVGLRVVLDTNVYVSAFHSRQGTLVPLWKQAQAGVYAVIVSPFIIREVARVLREVFFWEEPNILAWLRRIARVATIVRPATIPDAIPEDPADNHILACAVEGHADLIVSGDKDLLRIGEYRGIPIIRPMDFLRTLGGNTQS